MCPLKVFVCFSGKEEIKYVIACRGWVWAGCAGIRLWQLREICAWV
jgi:hypothetical protein